MPTKATIALISKPLIACLFITFTFSSCKKDNQDPVDVIPLKVSSATYQWGELAINKKEGYDVVKYNPGTGKIDSVIATGPTGSVPVTVVFSYAGNKLSLNTAFQDEYELDNNGRVITHITHEVQHGNEIASIQRYTYDANGYLNKVTMSSNFNSTVGIPFSEINYTVKNGNYTRFALSNIADGKVTREYNFDYNTSRTAYSPASLFAPGFANNTLSNIDKYLNFGKGSKNLLKAVNYRVINLDNTLVIGSFDAAVQVNAANYLTGLSLSGTAISGMPSDNLSPLPRRVSFVYQQ